VFRLYVVIIIRLYGDGTDLIIDRNIENSVFAQLSMLKFGPSFLGIFENGRVEQFIGGSHALTEEEMASAQLCPSIAASVASLHAQQVKLDDMTEVLFPTLFKFCDICEEQERKQHNGKFLTAKDSDEAPNLVANLGWMADVVRSKQLRREVEWMKSYLESFQLPAAEAVTVFNCASAASSGDADYWQKVGRQVGCDLAFCHNDLLCGNILLGTPTDEKAMTLIDYEYAGYNRSAYDIANHFDGKNVCNVCTY
jgi:ethanolamine kinase